MFAYFLSVGNFSPKTEGTKTRYLFFQMSFPFLYNECTFTFCQVCLLVKETVEIETGMAKKVQLGAGKHTAKLGLA
jgi:hypothetical protein